MKPIRKIGSTVKRMIAHSFRLFPVCDRKIVVSSYYGKGYGDNPKYIVDELLKSGTYKIIWLVKDAGIAKELPETVHPCGIGSLKAMYHYVTAKVWIDNCRKGFYFKRKNQLYIQTWHGFALKRIERDAVDGLADGYASFAARDSALIDVIVSCSKFMTDIYRKSFWYDGRIAEVGAPRNDVILNSDDSVKEKVYSYFNIERTKKIVLYAPTFRKDLSLTAYSIDIERVLKAFQRKTGDDYACLVRLHPNISAKSNAITYNDSKINASHYPDMQELLAAADAVISDYSSLMFDFALSGKPCFQFAVDIEDYKNDRNFYFDLSSLPFPLSTNNEELEENILRFDQDAYQMRLNDFFDEVGMVRNGDASRKIAQIIRNHCMTNQTDC